MAKSRSLRLASDGEQAVSDTVNEVLKQEVEGPVGPVGGPGVEGVDGDNSIQIKVEEITTPFEVPTVLAPSFTIVENTNVQVPEAEVKVESETKVESTEDAEAEKAARAVKASQDRATVRSLRKSDPSTKRTCASCMKRVPLKEIGFGHAEICDKCLGR